jgi:hypothetical protein
LTVAVVVRTTALEVVLEFVLVLVVAAAGEGVGVGG